MMAVFTAKLCMVALSSRTGIYASLAVTLMSQGSEAHISFSHLLHASCCHDFHYDLVCDAGQTTSSQPSGRRRALLQTSTPEDRYTTTVRVDVRSETPTCSTPVSGTTCSCNFIPSTTAAVNATSEHAGSVALTAITPGTFEGVFQPPSTSLKILTRVLGEELCDASLASLYQACTPFSTGGNAVTLLQGLIRGNLLSAFLAIEAEVCNEASPPTNAFEVRTWPPFPLGLRVHYHMNPILCL